MKKFGLIVISLLCITISTNADTPDYTSYSTANEALMAFTVNGINSCKNSNACLEKVGVMADYDYWSEINGFDSSGLDW